MSSPYPKPAREMVYDQINANNPGLPVALDEQNTTLSTPTVRTTSAADIRNSSVRIVPEMNLGTYRQKPTVNYRRLNLSVLFRGASLTIRKHSPRLPGSAGSLMYTVHELLPAINLAYGLNLTTDDVEDANILRSNTVDADGRYYGSVSMAAKATSYGYVGSVTLKWIQAPQDIADLITVNSLPGRQFPGGNDFSGSHSLILDNLAYPYDWTDMIVQYATGYARAPFAREVMSSGTTLAPFYQQLVTQLNTLHGTSLVFDTGSPDSANNLYRMYHRCVALPDAEFPEALSDQFNRLLLIEAKEANAWAAGMIYIHFNA